MMHNRFNTHTFKLQNVAKSCYTHSNSFLMAPKSRTGDSVGEVEVEGQVPGAPAAAIVVNIEGAGADVVANDPPENQEARRAAFADARLQQFNRLLALQRSLEQQEAQRRNEINEGRIPSDIYPMLCVLGCFSILFLSIEFAGLVVGSTDGNNSCQDSSAVISLQTWILTSCCAQITVILGLWLCVWPVVTGKVETWQPLCLLGILVTFFFAWFIVGIVIVSRDHHKCVSQGQDIGIMTVIYLAWHIIIIICSIFKNCCCKSD